MCHSSRQREIERASCWRIQHGSSVTKKVLKQGAVGSQVRTVKKGGRSVKQVLLKQMLMCVVGENVLELLPSKDQSVYIWNIAGDAIVADGKVLTGTLHQVRAAFACDMPLSSLCTARCTWFTRNSCVLGGEEAVEG